MKKCVMYIILFLGLGGCVFNSDFSKTPIAGTYIYHKGTNEDLILLVKDDYSAEVVTMTKTSSDNISFNLLQEIKFTPDETEMCGICEIGNVCMLIECKFTSQFIEYRIKNTPIEFKFNRIDSVVANGVKLVDWSSFVHLSQQKLAASSEAKFVKQPSELIDDYKKQIVNAIIPLVEIPINISQNTKVVVDVQLDSNLNVKSVKIIKSSGNSEFDRNIKSGIMRFRRFPDIPEGGNYSDYQKLRLTFQTD